MITAKEIKQILQQIPKGETLTIGEIQDFVKARYPLDADDWDIHTSTRPTNYRRWLHRLQAVLEEYKKKDFVIHNPAHSTYIFK